jgi:TetR/AcrR family transcriptional regulator, cholesterol catabolism regulator
MTEKPESKKFVRMGNEKRSKQILETACRLFANKGYDAVTTKEIAKVTKCSEALIFRYFPTKEIIYQALFDEWNAGMKDPVILEMIEGSSLKTLEKFYVDITGNKFVKNTKISPKLEGAIYSRVSKQKEIIKIIESSPDMVRDTIEPVIIKGQETGEIKVGSSFEMALTFWTLIAGEWYITRNFSGVHPKLTFDYIKGILF